MNILAKAVSRTVTILIWVLACVGVVTAAIFGMVKSGAISTLSVTSGSMEPTFSAGDMLISTPIPAADITVGDIITAPDAAGRLVTHRVTSVNDGTAPGNRLITMQGDANKAQDISPYLLEEALQMRWVIPHGADVMAFLTTPPVPYLGLLVIACFIGYTFLAPTSPKSQRSESLEEAQLEPAPVG